LVGRSVEQVVLRDAVAGLADGAVCVELVGDPGIGKTTMLAWLGELARGCGARVLGARGSEFEHDVAFGILVDALDGYLSELDDRWSRSLDADVVAELAGIFPALRRPGIASQAVAPGERFRAHRAIRTLLERLAATRPLVLVLDDVHWADSSSVELIGALLRRPPAARVLIALAHRSRQSPQRLVRELEAAAREGVLRRIVLGPLSEAEADSLLSEQLSGRDRRRLFADSGGNPFYLHQLARVGGGERAGRDIGAGVPLAVAASLFAELEAVSEGARGFAQAAAVAGDPFDLDLAAEVGGLARAEALAALDELVAADLLRPDGWPLGFAFRHPLVRRAVYESTQPGWRIAAHARADVSLARRGVAATARAHHVEQSARVGDERAIELLISAADAAIVPAAAARWLQAALRLMPADREQCLALGRRLGETLAAAGCLEESRAVLTDVLQRWPIGGDPQGRTRLIVVCAQVDRLLGGHRQAHARLAAAARELDDPDSAAGVAVALELATQHLYATRFEHADEQARAALRGAVALGDRVLHVSAVVLAGHAAFDVRDLARAHDLIAEAARLVAGLDDAALAKRPAVFLGLGRAERLLDRYAAAVEHFTRGVAVARAGGHSQLHVELTSGKAAALALWGRLDEAQAAAEEAVEAARLTENPQPLAWALAAGCLTHRECGNLVTAVSEGREAVALAVDRSLISAISGVSLGMSLVEGGDWTEGAELMLEWAGGVELPSTHPMQRPYVYEALTRAEIGGGRIEAGADFAGRALAVVDGLACDLPRAHAERAAARVLLAEGDAARAAERAVASADGADAVAARVEAGRSRLLAGRAFAAAGQRELAGEQLRAAELQLASCGAARLRLECVRELRRIGLRVAHAGRRGDGAARGPSVLSGRELQIAELVHARHTNREIAEQLFLSQKTVESHLRSVFVKLGVTSRAQVARALDVRP
jgi:DNA-binding NarL/FixJ family response regulator/tetratricopeptide (TPR) repeat protein